MSCDLEETAIYVAERMFQNGATLREVITNLNERDEFEEYSFYDHKNWLCMQSLSISSDFEKICQIPKGAETESQAFAHNTK